MTSDYSEVRQYWRGVTSTLGQRGLLRQFRQTADGGKEPVLPCTHYLVQPDYVAFVLDMFRLAGVSREQWLDADMWAQLRATLQGRRCFVADGAGLAVVVARNPDAERIRLPARLVLTPDLVPDGDYTATLGQSVGGPVILNLAEGERAILFGGSTGTGKTRTIISLVLQVAQKCGPDKLALAVVDLKRLDFVALDGLLHLVRPVATSESDAEALVAWCVQEMERRQVVMQAANVTRWDRMGAARFPLLVVVVDEVADFAGGDVMADLVKLARKGRASGVSLILATQRPDAQVLSRQVKANVTARVAFRVTDNTESRIILDRTGAEKLRRRGLALTNVGGTWRKVQCAFVPDDATGDWCEVAPTGPVLSEVEVSLVRYAVQELDGAFVVNRLYDAHKADISKYKLTNLARTWETRGWLTSETRTDEGHKVGRLVTPELASLTLDAPERGIVASVTMRGMGARTVTRLTEDRDVACDVDLPPFLAHRGR